MVKILNTSLWEDAKKRKWLTVLALFGIAFLASLLTRNNILRSGLPTTDSSVFLYIGRSVTKGYIPYRDTFDHKGPLIYLINALGYSISPKNGIWLVELVFLFGTVCCVYKISRLCTDAIKSLIVTLICIAQLSYWMAEGNFTEEYAMLFIGYALLVFLDYFQNQKVTKVRLMLTGFSFAAVCLLRANMIAVWFVFCLAVLCQCIAQRRWKELGQFLLYFLIGAAALALPIMLWLAYNGAMEDFLECYIGFNMLYTGSEGGIKNVILSMEEFYLYPIITVAFTAGAFVYLRDRRKLDALYVCFLAIAMVMMCMSGRTYQHYALALVPAFAYPLARSIEPLRMDAIKAGNVVLLGAAIMLILPCIEQYAYLLIRDNHYSEGETRILELCRMIEENTDEDDKIIVDGNDNYIYLLSNRDSLSRYSYQYPIAGINAEIAEEYYNDIKSKEAKMVVLFDDSWNYKEAKELLEELGYVKIAEANRSFEGETPEYAYLYSLG